MDLLLKARAVFTAGVTAVIGVATALAVFAAEVAPLLPNGWQDNAVAIGGFLAAVIAAATAILKSVVPAPANLPRTVLPVTAEAQQRDTGSRAVTRAIAAAVAVALVGLGCMWAQNEHDEGETNVFDDTEQVDD